MPCPLRYHIVQILRRRYHLIVAVLFRNAGVVIADKIAVNAAVGVVLIRHILECVRRERFQIRQCQRNRRIRQLVCLCIFPVIRTCFQQFLTKILISHCIFQHLAGTAGNTAGIGIPFVFLVCSTAEILGINIDTQPRQLRIQIEAHSGLITRNRILEVIATQDHAGEMVIVYRIGDRRVIRCSGKCHMGAVFLDAFAQGFQTIVILVHIVAVLSALCGVVCICIHIQSLRHRKISGCLCVGQPDLSSGNRFRKALCPNHPTHLTNRFVQIDAVVCDLLLQRFVGAVKMQVAGFQ